jgi:Flp pilus assembly pilin Flp
MNELAALMKDETGVTTVEIILILLVLIALVLIFKKQLISLVNSILGKVTSQGESV